MLLGFSILTLYIEKKIVLPLQEVNMAYDNVKEVDSLDVSKEGTDAWEAALRRFVIFHVR